MNPDLVGQLHIDVSKDAFSPEKPDASLAYVGLRCPCGQSLFHLSGWPRVATGRGGYFWRSVSRVWREARVVMKDGEPVESPFWLPLAARCEHCGTESIFLNHESVVGRLPAAAQSDPRESYRCRLCRRGVVSLVVGCAEDEGPGRGSPAGVAVEVVTRCDRCHRQDRIAWSDGRPSGQQVRLDLLYGRR
ncbi:MAG: hypothetical protein AB8G23_07040 [Myxococcota bacterium]